MSIPYYTPNLPPSSIKKPGAGFPNAGLFAKILAKTQRALRAQSCCSRLPPRDRAKRKRLPFYIGIANSGCFLFPNAGLCGCHKTEAASVFLIKLKGSSPFPLLRGLPFNYLRYLCETKKSNPLVISKAIVNIICHAILAFPHIP